MRSSGVGSWEVWGVLQQDCVSECDGKCQGKAVVVDRVSV
jgi:hypothetical protein